MRIYVEARIHGSLDEVWRRTQDPALHERWDLRFTAIEYLPRTGDSEMQRFLYSTRIGLGLTVHGEGETICSCEESTGVRTSSLRFWSDDPKSLIREGAGYWQYVPTADGIRFITGYDYQVRFGGAGRLFDRLVFRPLMGWATAWSFDRLRLWIEKGIDPALSAERALIHLISRFSLTFVWLYQGLVPKLLAADRDELTLLAEAGVPESIAPRMLTWLGGAEVAFGLIVLFLARSRWPLVLTMILMLLATLTVAIHSPTYLAVAFNPVALNLQMAAVALISLLTMRDLPSARRCLRRKPEKT